MAVTNIAMFVIAALLTYGPLVTHAACEIGHCGFALHPSYYPSGIDSGRCLRCADMSQDQLVIQLNIIQLNSDDIDGLVTRNINFTNNPFTDQQILNMVYIEINQNRENMNFKLMKNFSKLRHFRVRMSNTQNQFEGYYISNNTQYHINIDFQYNNIKTIKSLCQGYYRPTWDLYLANNEINSFTKSHIGRSNCSSKLWFLDLSFNNLTSLFTDIFLHLPALEELDVSHNQISVFQNNLNISSPRIKLEHLDMGHNKLSELNDESFKYLINLDTLNLTDNNLKYLYINVLSQLTKLKFLDLSNNKLYSLDAKIFSKTSELETLSVAGNHLIIFDLQNIQSNWNTLMDIDLTRNEWDCEELHKLILYLSEKHKYSSVDKDKVIKEQNIRGINCYNSSERLIQFGHMIESKINQQILRQASEHKSVISNISAELKNSLENMSSNVNNIAADVKNSLKEISANVTSIAADVKNSLKEMLNAADFQKSQKEISSNVSISADFQSSLKEMKMYIVILAGVLAAVIVVPACVLVHVRHRRGGDCRGTRGVYADTEMAPVRCQEPVYHYALSSGVEHSLESHIYEELPYIHPSTIPVGSAVHVDNSGAAMRREHPECQPVQSPAVHHTRQSTGYLEPRVCNPASTNQGPGAVTSSDKRPAGPDEAGLSSSPACDKHTPVYTEIIG